MVNIFFFFVNDDNNARVMGGLAWLALRQDKEGKKLETNFFNSSSSCMLYSL